MTFLGIISNFSLSHPKTRNIIDLDKHVKVFELGFVHDTKILSGCFDVFCPCFFDVFCWFFMSLTVVLFGKPYEKIHIFPHIFCGVKLHPPEPNRRVLRNQIGGCSSFARSGKPAWTSQGSWEMVRISGL